MKKHQIFYIHGGMTFKTKKEYLHWLKHRDISVKSKLRWSGEYLTKSLGKNFDIIRLRMPLSEDAYYSDWATHFSRYLPFMKKNVILIGESLGGVFFAKYLSENKLKHKALSVFLVCPPFDNTLGGEDLVNGFTLKSDLSLLEKNTKNLYLLFAKKDDVVPVTHAAKYAKKLKNAKIVVYKHIKGHFRVSEFPEIVKLIKSDLKK